MKFINTVLAASLLFTLSSQGLLAEETPEIKKLNERILKLEGLIEQGLSQSTPPKAIMAFYLKECPVGWLPADGKNETPDLRGEFIRGWDTGAYQGEENYQVRDKFYELDKDLKATSKGRLLGSWQAPTLITTEVEGDGFTQISIKGPKNIPESISNARFYISMQADRVGNWYGDYLQGIILYEPPNSRPWFETFSPSGFNSEAPLGGTRPRNVALLYCMKE